MSAPVPPDAGGRFRGGRLLRAALTERIGLKASAALLSVLLWVVVGARQPTEATVNARVVATLDSSLALLDAAPRVQVVVAGRAADIVKLYAMPPVIRRTVSGDAPDTLVLDVQPSDVHIAPELVNLLRVIDVQPRSVMLRFASRATRRVRVVDAGRILVLRDSTAFAASGDAVSFKPAWVHVTGPRLRVRALRGVHPLSLTIAAGDSLPHVADLDTMGLGVRVLPPQVRVVMRTRPTVASPSP